jgi:sec-independent protein translocase protein TatA
MEARDDKMLPVPGAGELILLLVIVLIIFGPGKLPDIGSAVGKGIREFRRASSDLEDSVRGEPKRPAQEERSASESSER